MVTLPAALVRLCLRRAWLSCPFRVAPIHFHPGLADLRHRVRSRSRFLRVPILTPQCSRMGAGAPSPVAGCAPVLSHPRACTVVPSACSRSPVAWLRFNFSSVVHFRHCAQPQPVGKGPRLWGWRQSFHRGTVSLLRHGSLSDRVPRRRGSRSALLVERQTSGWRAAADRRMRTRGLGRFRGQSPPWAAERPVGAEMRGEERASRRRVAAGRLRGQAWREARCRTAAAGLTATAAVRARPMESILPPG